MVAENFVPSLESLSSLGFEEMNLGSPGNFAGMSRTLGDVQKVCAKKFVRIFRFLSAIEAWVGKGPHQGMLRFYVLENTMRPLSTSLIGTTRTFMNAERTFVGTRVPERAFLGG